MSESLSFAGRVEWRGKNCVEGIGGIWVEFIGSYVA